jgi:uncharacterized protein
MAGSRDEGRPGPAGPRVDVVIPPGEYYATLVARGQTVRIVDVEGKQCADWAAFNLNQPPEKLSCVYTKTLNRAWQIGKGHIIYSDLCNPMFEITEDTVGVHTFFGGFCSEELNYVRYGVHGTRNCRDNFALAVAPYGIAKRDVWPDCSPTFFMYVADLPDGKQETREPLSKAGDYVEMAVRMDCLLAISNCPQDRNPCNGFSPSSLRLIVR